MALAFGDLNQDIKHDVLKYLSLIERVKLERVNQEWRQVIDSLWKSQLALKVTSKPFSYQTFEETCPHDHHQVRQKDTLALNKRDGLCQLPFAVLLAIISKCINLTALHLYCIDEYYSVDGIDQVRS